jgi:hypothetical protein
MTRADVDGAVTAYPEVEHADRIQSTKRKTRPDSLHNRNLLTAAVGGTMRSASGSRGTQ